MEITTFSYSYGKNRYNLSFAWDDKALEDGVIAFPITAWITSSDGSEKIGDPLSAKVGVDQNTGMLFIDVKKRRFEIPLKDVFHEDTVVGQAIEKVHASFIGVDPVTGCLIRAGLSTSVGQIIKCKDETATEKWTLERVHAIGGCLKKNIPKMLMRTAFRAAACVFKAGF